MADLNSINLAKVTIDKLNNMGIQLRNVAKSMVPNIAELNSIITDDNKKAILQDGLAGLSVNPAELKARKELYEGVIQYILDNVPELTS